MAAKLSFGRGERRAKLYYVAFREDIQADGKPGKLVLSSKTFDHYEDACAYADTISRSRQPIVLALAIYTGPNQKRSEKDRLRS